MMFQCTIQFTMKLQFITLMMLLHMLFHILIKRQPMIFQRVTQSKTITLLQDYITR